MKIDLTGYNIDNLLKILYSKKIILKNIVRAEYNKISFEILDKDYKKVKRYIKNFKATQTLSKIKQFPKFVVANAGVLLGCFLGLIFGVFVSRFTWQIQIFGTKDLQTSEIISVLSENGIKKGKINTQTSEEIEEILLNKYDRIAQVSVIKYGTAIIINLSEKLVYNEVEFEPILAKYAGIIKEINIITGTVNVKVGDYVNVGDVLVLPFILNSKGEKVAVEPMAEIKAEMYVLSKSELKKTEQILVRTGRTKKVFKYKFKNINLFQGKAKNSFALFETNVYNENISDLLPLNRDVVTYYELKTQQIEHDFESEKATLVEKSIESAYKILPTGKILSEKSETSIVNDVMYAVTTITVFGVIS